MTNEWCKWARKWQKGVGVGEKKVGKDWWLLLNISMVKKYNLMKSQKKREN